MPAETKKDLKTTIGGVLAGLAIIFTQVSYALDEDQLTVMSLVTIGGAIALIYALLGAKDA